MLRRFWVRAGILLAVHDHVYQYDDASKDAFYQVEELIASVDRSFGLTWFLTNSRKMFARKLISRKGCRATRSQNASRPLVLVYRERRVHLYVIFVALEIMESDLTFYDDNRCKFHVLYACTGDACALETRRGFVTEHE